MKTVQATAAQGAEPAPAEPKQEPKHEPESVPVSTLEQDSKAASITAPSSSPSVPAVDVDLIEQAKAGDAKAQYILGYDYYKGKGIAKDFAQAAVWWRKSADQGFAFAQNNLGVLYNSGMGVPQSFSEAYFWQNLAAAGANGDWQEVFAKNRDESAARLSGFERLRVQKRAAKWAEAHPVPPRSHEPPPAQP